MKFILAALLCAVLGCTAFAVEPGEMLKDPALEARAREVSKSLRCLVCQNETIDDSEAELARDIRVLVRKRIVAGDSNQQVIAYMVQRYGDFVLLKPRFTATTLALWFGPLIVLVLGGIAVWRRLHGAPPPAPQPLSAEEREALKAVTGEIAS